MPLYAYLCDACGASIDSQTRADHQPCDCGANARRRWGFNRQTSSFSGGFNPAVGRHVGSMGELRSAFSKMSEEQSEFTGNVVDIQPVDLRDREAVGITDADVERLNEEKARVAQT